MSTDYIIPAVFAPWRSLLILSLLLDLFPLRTHAQNLPAAPDPQAVELNGDTDEEDHPMDSDEAEEKGIIPHGAGILVSTQPITPLTVFTEKKPYDAAMEILARAEDLWKKGETEAASDLALEAYDDLMEIHLPRIRKKSKNKKELQARRDQIRADRRRAATVYVESSIDYVQSYVKKQKSTPEAIAEGRDRLADLRDVAINYDSLNAQLNKAQGEMK